MQELCLHLISTQLHSVEFKSTSLVAMIFSVHSSTNLFTYLFFALKIFVVFRITGFITFSLKITRNPNKSFFAYTFINQFFAFIPAFIIIPTLFIIRNITVKSAFTLTRFTPFYASCFISS